MKILHAMQGVQQSCGISKFVLETTRELQRAGHTAAIVTTRNWNAPADDLHLVETLEPARFADEFTPQIVHIHGAWNHYVRRMAAWCRARGIPYVLSPHGAWTPWAMHYHRLRKWLAWLWFQRKDAHGAAAFHVTVQSEAEDIRRLGLAQPVVIAPLGVRQPEGELPPLASRPKAVLCLGRLHVKKNIDGLLRAWAQVPATLREGWRLLIAGKAGLGDDDYLKSLHSLASPDCEFLGEVMGEDKDRLYRQVRLFVLPSFSENFGAVIPEALSYGVPAIATTGTPWQCLQKAQCGWWVAPTPKALADTLAQAMTIPPDQFAAWGVNARALATRDFSWQRTADTLLDAYRKIVPTG